MNITINRGADWLNSNVAASLNEIAKRLVEAFPDEPLKFPHIPEHEDYIVSGACHKINHFASLLGVEGVEKLSEGQDFFLSGGSDIVSAIADRALALLPLSEVEEKDSGDEPPLETLPEECEVEEENPTGDEEDPVDDENKEEQTPEDQESNTTEDLE